MPNEAKRAFSFSASATQVGPTNPEKSVVVVPSGLTVKRISRICYPLDDYFTVVAVKCLGCIAQLLKSLHRGKCYIHLDNFLLHLLKQGLDVKGITDKRQLTG